MPKKEETKLNIENTTDKKDLKLDKSFTMVAKVLKKPVVTEKSELLSKSNNEYVFKVNIDSNKKQIKKSIENLYDVKVESVNTILRKGKQVRFGKVLGRRSDEKIAIVKIQTGQSINVFK